MFQQILVGCDTGPGTTDALRLAAELAAMRDDAQLVLVHAYPPAANRFGRRGKEEELDDALHGEGMRLLEGLRETLPDAQRADVELLSLPVSSPAYALHDLAVGRGADLLVIGPAQHGPIGRLVLGSDSTGILHGAPCPVAIPPRSADADRAHDADATRAAGAIGVGYDGSEASDRAVDLAAGIARAQGRPLHVIGVADVVAWPIMDAGGGIAAVPPLPPDPVAVQADVEEMLQARLQTLPDDVSAQAIARHGSAIDELADCSTELHLLVVGSRNYGPVRHILLGSTSRPVLDRARCPVLVVPRPPEAD